MPKLLTHILPQSFELIRTRIAEILADELDNQAIVFLDNDLKATVWIERSIPFDKTSTPAVNIELGQGMYDNESCISSDGTYTFHIDCFTSAKSNTESSGDKLSALRLQRLLGACRAILKNQAYITLGFARPFIERVTVGSMQIAAAGTSDAESIRMGRLILTVRVPETSELAQPVVVNSYQTKFTVNETDLGYVMEFTT